jgi:hypothetical protein
VEENSSVNGSLYRSRKNQFILVAQSLSRSENYVSDSYYIPLIVHVVLL